MLRKLDNFNITTTRDHYGLIPEPIPARKLMPNWYKKLQNTTKDSQGWPRKTLKRCPPVLDSMVSGYILRLAAEVQIKVAEDGSVVEWECEYHAPILQSHNNDQIAGHPKLPCPPLKFLNYWQVTTPKGWSTLFVPPLNREEKHLDLMPGIVETDKYFEFVNFPGFIKDRGTTITLPMGYPLMQAIPFKRSGLTRKAVVRMMTEREHKKLETTRLKRGAQPSLYRETMWEPK